MTGTVLTDRPSKHTNASLADPSFGASRHEKEFSALPLRRRARSGSFLLQLFKQAFHSRQARLELGVLGLHSIDVEVEGFDLSGGDVGAGEIVKGGLVENAYPVAARLMRD